MRILGKILAMMVLLVPGFVQADTIEDSKGLLSQPDYEEFLSPGDEIMFKVNVTAYKYADGAFLVEIGDQPGEDEGEFLTTLYCDIGLKKYVDKDTKIPLKGEIFKVIAIEGQYGQFSSYKQSGAFVTIESQSENEDVANINLLVCLKQSHQEWPPESGVHLQLNELGQLADEGFFMK